LNFNQILKIDNSIISKDSPTFIIAEAGVNHGGDIKVAKELIDLAVLSGVNAVKFQMFKTENLILKNVSKAPYQKKIDNKVETQFDMLKKLELSKDESFELKKYCEKKGIIFLTTPFDEFSLDELDDLALPAYKIASTDITNLPFLKKVALKNKPILLSTGMSYLAEIQLALEVIYKYNQDVVLLHCTANYPTRDFEVNLAVLETFKKNFNMLLGYSDHTEGLGAAAFAIPMGVKIVEKHFTIDKDYSGPDHSASLSPSELTEFVNLIRKVDSFMGSDIKKPTLSEIKTRESLQKCLVAKCNIKKGSVFSEENIIGKRTGGKGISPIYYQELIGKVAHKEYFVDDIILNE